MFQKFQFPSVQNSQKCTAVSCHMALVRLLMCRNMENKIIWNGILSWWPWPRAGMLNHSLQRGLRLLCVRKGACWEKQLWARNESLRDYVGAELHKGKKHSWKGFLNPTTPLFFCVLYNYFACSILFMRWMPRDKLNDFQIPSHLK